MALKKRHIEIIGVPVDLGAGRRGVDMGPSAIRIADLEPRLESLGHKVLDSGDLDVMIPETQKVGAGKLRYKAPILAACDELRHARRGQPGARDGCRSCWAATTASRSARWRARATTCASRARRSA